MCEIRFCKKCGAQVMITTAGEYCPNCHYNTALYSTTYVSDRSDGEYHPTVSKKETVALKPCPFCGSKDVAYSSYISGTDVEGIECSGCGIVFVPTSYCEDTAIEEWNRRVKE